MQILSKKKCIELSFFSLEGFELLGRIMCKFNGFE